MTVLELNYVEQAGLKLTEVHLPLSSKCAPQCLAQPSSLFFFFKRDDVSQWSPDWPVTRYVDQACLKLRSPDRYRWLSASMWVLGTKPGSSARQQPVLFCWAVSPPPQTHSRVLFFYLKCIAKLYFKQWPSFSAQCVLYQGSDEVCEVLVFTHWDCMKVVSSGLLT